MSNEQQKTMYMENGQEVEVLQMVPNDRGALVQQLYEDCDTGEMVTSVITKWVPAVYANPPVPRLHETAKQLNEALAKTREELAELNRERLAIKNEESAYWERVNRLAELPNLDRLERYLDGGFTHYVRDARGEVEIIPAGEMDKEENGNTKLLCLMGDPHGGVDWYLNSYRDGSGIWTMLIPCSSHEEAKEAARALVREGLAKAKPSTGRLGKRIADADKYGVDVPEDVRRDHQERLRKDAIAMINITEREFEAAKKKLDELPVDH